ncbi:MAG: DUF4399 domain-containing protein [Parvibaculum sp.]|nr:DUF4399 domain-containing protein [Parvibaculum sp.]
MAFFKSAALATTLLASAFVFSAHAEDAANPWPEGAKPYIISPADGATVKSPVTVIFGLKGLGVAPAGVEKPKTGHHHLLIDTAAPSGEDLGFAIPTDDNHKHFGGGQTETTIELTPGKHTLQLMMGDAAHVPHHPPLVSDVVTITVE